MKAERTASREVEGDLVDEEAGSGAQAIVPTTAQALSHADILTQVDIAKRYPRNIARFLRDLRRLVTANEEIAESCFYVLRRKDRRTNEVKRIEGRSIRFAEIAAGCFTNLRYGARGVDVGDRFVTVHGAGIDLESNVGVEAPASRRITTSGGSRYGDDMIGVTIAAATSIAMRNVVLRLIPMAYTEDAYQAAKKAAIGDAKSLQDRRQKVIERFRQMGVTVEEILAYVERPSVEFISLEDLEDLIGVGTAIKEGTQSIDEAFNRGPKPEDQPVGKTSFGFKEKAEAPGKPPESGTGAPNGPAKTDSPADETALREEAREREQKEAAGHEGPSKSRRVQFLEEIEELENKRRMPAKDRSGLWRQFVGTATKETADETALEALRDHLRRLVGSQISLT